MLALIVGIIVAVVGVMLIGGPIRFWGPHIWTAIRGSVPLCLIGGGLLAVIAGITTIKDSIEAKKLEEEKKKEVEKK